MTTTAYDAGSRLTGVTAPDGGGARHSVIVDGAASDGTILIRGPWAGGSTYRVSDDDFLSSYAGSALFRK